MWITKDNIYVYRLFSSEDTLNSITKSLLVKTNADRVFETKFHYVLQVKLSLKSFQQFILVFFSL